MGVGHQLLELFRFKLGERAQIVSIRECRVFKGTPFRNGAC